MLGEVATLNMDAIDQVGTRVKSEANHRGATRTHRRDRITACVSITTPASAAGGESASITTPALAAARERAGAMLAPYSTVERGTIAECL